MMSSRKKLPHRPGRVRATTVSAFVHVGGETVYRSESREAKFCIRTRVVDRPCGRVDVERGWEVLVD